MKFGYSPLLRILRGISIESKGDTLETKKSKKVSERRKKMKGEPFSLVRFCMLRLKKSETGPFAIT